MVKKTPTQDLNVSSYFLLLGILILSTSPSTIDGSNPGVVLGHPLHSKTFRKNLKALWSDIFTTIKLAAILNNSKDIRIVMLLMSIVR